jgi:hypothetical protein
LKGSETPGTGIEVFLGIGLVLAVLDTVGLVALVLDLPKEE